MRARVLITACVTGALCACAPSFASQGPEDALRDLLAAHAGIVKIDVTEQSVEVVVDDQGSYKRVVATPDWGSADVYESPWTPGTSGYVPSVAAATFDVDDLMTRANDLARRCESWTTSTVAINDQATTTLAYCGNEAHQSLNGVDLRPLPTVWSQGAFLQMWDEFAVVAPDGEVPIVRIDSQEVYTAIPQPDGLCAQSHVRLVEWGAMGTRGCGASGSQPGIPLDVADARTVWRLVERMSILNEIPLDDEALVVLERKSDQILVHLTDGDAQVSSVIEMDR